MRQTWKSPGEVTRVARQADVDERRRSHHRKGLSGLIMRAPPTPPTQYIYSISSIQGLTNKWIHSSTCTAERFSALAVLQSFRANAITQMFMGCLEN